MAEERKDLTAAQLEAATTISSGGGGELVEDADPLPLVDPGVYALGDEIAQGGGGRVLRAFDQRLGRWVALKLLHEPDPRLVARFTREATVTAHLEHPGIVPVYEVGRWPNGQVFYAMRLITGRSLGQVIAATRTLDERLALLPHVLAAAEAMAYAHSKRVLHRDLKPSNIMVGPFGETVVIDWGLAKELGVLDDGDAAAWSSPEVTDEGTVLGTPAFMAPEQAAGAPVDERADVYALGAILYAVLSGAPPYDGARSRDILASVRRGPPTPLAERERGVPAELVDVAAKAMQRDAAARYPDAAALAGDLRRFHHGQLVGAHRYSRGVLLWRWLARHRASVAVVAAALAAIVATVALSFQRVVRARNLAEARGNALRLSQARAALDADPTLALAWARAYLAAGGDDTAAVGAIAADADSRGVARHVLLRCWRAVLAPDGARVACLDGGRLRIWSPRGTSAVPDALGASVMRFTPDGALVWTGKDGAVRRRRDGAAATVLGELGQPGSALAVGAGGAILAGGEGGALLFIDAAGARALPPHASSVVATEVSRDGRFAVSAANDGAARLHRIGGASRDLESPPDLSALAFSAAGPERLAWGGDDGGVRLLDLERDSMRVLHGHQYKAARVAFSPDGKQLASTGIDKTVRLWDLAGDAAPRVLPQPDIAFRVAFSPDGRLLAAADQSGRHRVIDLETGDSVTLRGQRNPAERVQFSADSRTLLTSTSDGETRLWAVAPSRERVLGGLGAAFVALARRADGQLVSASSDGVLRWDVTRGARLASGPAPMADGEVFELLPDGETVVVVGDDLDAVGVADGKRRRLAAGKFVSVALAADSKQLFGLAADGRLWALDLAGAAPRALARVPLGGYAFAASRDGRRLAVGCDDAVVRLVDVAGGGVRELRGHEHRILDVVFSPDGARLASGGTDTVVRLWDTASGTLRPLAGHAGSVHRLVFAPDGARLASASIDGTVRLWQLASGGARVLTLGSSADTLAFSADSALVYTGSADGVLRLWDAAGGSAIRVLRGHHGEIGTLLVDDAWLATAGDDHTIRVWPLDAAIRRAPTLDALTSAVLVDAALGDARAVTP